MSTNFAFILRRFNRNKLTTLLHIVGLTLGITVCLLIGLFIRHELSFDGYESKAARTYRVNQIWVDDGNREYHFSTPFPLADQIRKDISGLENVTKVHHPFNNVIQINPLRRFKQDRVMMTDPEFLDVFDVKVIEGNAHEALRKPFQAVLTETTAKKFFGNENPIGKTFTYNDSFLITVGALIKDFPGNTHLPASMLLSLVNNGKYLQTNPTHYGSVSGGSTFIVLPKGMSANAALKAGLNGIYDRTINNEKWMRKNSHCELEIQPLSDIHFNSKYAGGGELVQATSKSWLWFFGSVGFAVLLLACINFVNLSTAQALTRAKEVGVRKTIGAGRLQLIRQFLGEALLLVILSAIVGILITRMVLPALNRMAGKQITFDLFQSAGLMGSLVTGILLTALLAGLYPAWLITKFKPATTLKAGAARVSPQSGLLRKGLVVAQFSISICLLIAVLLIGKQLDFIRNRNLGFNKENTVLVRLPSGPTATNENRELFRSQLMALADVKGVSMSTSPPSGGENTHWGTLMSLVGRDDPQRKEVTTIYTDDKYCQLYGMKLVAGRLMNISDTSYVSESLPEGQRFAKSVVNETLVKALGFPNNETALGKRFWIGMNGWTAEVVGVISDFNVGSLHEVIKPTLITQAYDYYDLANIKIQAKNIPGVVDKINAAYRKIYPSGVFEFDFLDQKLDALYKTEDRLFSLFKIFSAMAILISCLGLWGLISFSAQQRVKEIGIRKVLGASLPNIVNLLTRDFLLLVGISILIASPLAYWGMHRWLEDFAFRIHIGWIVFIVAGVSAILIAMLTVSVQAIRAAIANPAKSLRTE